MIIALFSLSIGLLAFLLFFGMIKKKVMPKQAITQRIKSLNRTTDQLQHKRELPKLAGGHKGRDLRDIPFVDRVIFPIKSAIENRLENLTPKKLLSYVQRRLVLAGKSRSWTPKAFLGGWATAVLVWTLIFGNLALQQESWPIVQKVMWLLMGAGIGIAFPVAMLNRLIKNRQQEMLRQLPELLDLLCVSVQAGLTFDASMRKITERMQGTLVTECQIMLDEVRMGVSRKQALKALAERCDLQEVYLFTTAIIQAERLGTSMSQTLIVQAENMRERRRQYIKAMAMKAPVKIIFPLVLFIFPSIFVVALGPTIISLLKGLKG